MSPLQHFAVTFFESLHRGPCAHLGANGGLNSHFVLLSRDNIFELNAESLSSMKCNRAVANQGERIALLTVEQDIELDHIGGFYLQAVIAEA